MWLGWEADGSDQNRWSSGAKSSSSSNDVHPNRAGAIASSLSDGAVRGASWSCCLTLEVAQAELKGGHTPGRGKEEAGT